MADPSQARCRGRVGPIPKWGENDRDIYRPAVHQRTSTDRRRNPRHEGSVARSGHQLMTLFLLAESVRADAAVTGDARRRMELVEQELLRAMDMITDHLSGTDPVLMATGLNRSTSAISRPRQRSWPRWPTGRRWSSCQAADDPADQSRGRVARAVQPGRQRGQVGRPGWTGRDKRAAGDRHRDRRARQRSRIRPGTARLGGPWLVGRAAAPGAHRWPAEFTARPGGERGRASSFACGASTRWCLPVLEPGTDGHG